MNIPARSLPLFLLALAMPLLASSPTIAEPPSVSFLNDVVPLLDSRGCNATQCHGATAGRGGLKLSMFAADPDADHTALTRSDKGRRVNRVEPLESLLLLKATASIEHGGKQRIDPDGPEFKLLADWLNAGAPGSEAEANTLETIEVSPAATTLATGKSQTISATAVFSDGSRKNVTRLARYASSDEAVATVDNQGEVAATGFGQTYIVATYNRRSAVIRVAVPRPVEGEFPKSVVHNRIDELVLAKLEELGIPPSELSTDGEFFRRVHLDVIGTLPTPDEVLAFAADDDPNKRTKLIDALLERDEFADFWALKWGDLLRIKAEYPSNLWPNGVQAYYQLVRDGIVANKPYDQFVRELLVSTGSNFRDPAANYYRAMKKRDPQGFADATALVFMGARIGCARCHGHPTESWTLDDDVGMAAFFAQIKFKSTKEWKEEIVYLDPDATMRDPRTRATVEPKLLGGEVVPIEPGKDPRVTFADWLTAPENPWFARNITNRVWFWLLGRGIVHEPDDMRPTNPPSNPELLAYLEQELINHDFDLKHVYRLILNSATYQRSSTPVGANASDTAFFSHYTLKRLSAENLSDAIGGITGVWDKFSSRIPEPYSVWPTGFRAAQMADGSVGTPFLELFGRPPRDTAYEGDRDCGTSVRQALFLINSSTFESKVTNSPRIKRWIKDGTKDEKIIEQLFLLAVSRPVTDAEKQQAIKYIEDSTSGRAQALQDLMWAVLNTKEFRLNH